MPDTLQTSQLVTALQQAVGPVVVISGVGLLILSMTNRLGRIVDHSRRLAHEARTTEDEAAGAVHLQLRILGQRARLVRWAILFAGICVLFIALLVISLFVTALFGVQAPWLIAGFFIVSMLFLISSLVMFVRDINKALHATAVEVGEDWKKK
jgi:hypothetical protein